jgi:hypothetical protein
VIRNCAITVRPLLAEELAALQRLVAVSRGPA